MTPQVPEPKLTAADVREALRARWPADQHVFIDEAPDGPTRMGRKLDVLVCSTWRSRGFELDGVEVKVSTSDWKRELDNPAKADWWFEHVHRFWIAAPAKVATTIRPDLPAGWGLLAVHDTKVRALVKPQRHDATPFEWPEIVGLLRAAANAGPGALGRQYQLGFDAGVQQGRRQGEAAADPSVSAEREERVRALCTRFEAVAGVSLEELYGERDVERLARLVAAVRSSGLDYYASTLRRVASQLNERGTELASLVSEIEEVLPK